ncbi:MAG TPA: hypothetical protein VML01_07575 [Bryobacterales bacterium]|nr:hypothetical protein [Bryobacterales bacterium]
MAEDLDLRVERSIPPGEARGAHIRPADQVIVFLNDVSYDRIDAKTGETASRSRNGPATGASRVAIE